MTERLTVTGQVIHLSPHELLPHPKNPRVIDDDSVKTLVESIMANGVQIELHITPEKVILGGHRRHHAAILARQETVPCIVRDIPPEGQLRFIIDENIERKSLSPIEEGRIYQELLQEYRTMQNLIRATGFPLARVQNRLLLLRLPTDVQRMYHEAKLPLKAAPWLLEVKDEARITAYAVRLCALEPLTRLQKEHAARLKHSQGETEHNVPRTPVETPRRTKAPHEALLPVEQISEIRAIYWQNPPFSASSTKLANVSRQTCQDCGNTDQAVCQRCPLFLFMKHLPVPSALEQLVKA